MASTAVSEDSKRVRICVEEDEGTATGGDASLTQAVRGKREDRDYPHPRLGAHRFHGLLEKFGLKAFSSPRPHKHIQSARLPTASALAAGGIACRPTRSTTASRGNVDFHTSNRWSTTALGAGTEHPPHRIGTLTCRANAESQRLASDDRHQRRRPRARRGERAGRNALASGEWAPSADIGGPSRPTCADSSPGPPDAPHGPASP